MQNCRRHIIETPSSQQISDEEYAYLDSRLVAAGVDPRITCKMDLDTMKEIVAIEYSNSDAISEPTSEEQEKEIVQQEEEEGIAQRKLDREHSFSGTEFRGQSFSAPGR